MSPTLVPLLIRAHLAGGIAHASPWGTALDGLLAAELWADHKATARDRGELVPRLQDTDNPTDIDLPLDRCTSPDGTWHWAATSAHPDGPPTDTPDVHYWTGRTDSRALEELTPTLPATLSDRQGRYRARRVSLLVTPCPSVTFSGVGDPTAIAHLLRPLRAIGKKRSHGEGHVLRWEITPTPDVVWWDAAHLHPDGTLGRPTPDHCLHDHPDLLTGGHGTAGLRPPTCTPHASSPCTCPPSWTAEPCPATPASTPPTSPPAAPPAPAPSTYRPESAPTSTPTTATSHSPAARTPSSHLATQADPNVPVVFFDSGLEYPETYTYLAQLQDHLGLQLHHVHPRRSALQVLHDSGAWDHDAPTPRRPPRGPAPGPHHRPRRPRPRHPRPRRALGSSGHRVPRPPHALRHRPAR